MNKEFWNEVTSLINPVTKLEIEYRFYYNDLGDIVECTQSNHPESEYPFIVVLKEQYDRYFEYRVVNGVLKKIDKDAGYRVQLIRSTRGYPTVANHAGLLIEPGEEYNNIEYYEPRNN